MRKFILMSLCLLVAAGTTAADWDPGDGHKMHFPQLPDPDGWDVDFFGLADDWLCTQTGPVKDIHLWVSWEGDFEGSIESMLVAIYNDDSSGPFSKPAGTEVWGKLLDPGEFTIRSWGTGTQGWYDPVSGEYAVDDHENIYQINIENITDPFQQEEGTIYWLGVALIETPGYHLGWKTSGDHFEDNAVYLDGEAWHELTDPLPPYESLDLAFVITPEPATIFLLGLGGLLLRRRKK